MPTQISIKKGESNPTNLSGLTLAEPVFVSTNNTLWIGKGSGVTPVWVGAGICGASSGIAAGLTYQIPTLAAVKNYVTSTSITDYVSSFNGATGAVTGVTVGGANVFTALNSFNAGICASGITLSSGIINAPGAGLYLTSANTKNAKVNLLGGPSSSQVELDAITVRVRNTTDSALPTFELYEATDVYSAKMQYTSSATNDATITFPAITGTVALTNQVVTSVNGQTGAVTVSGGTNVVTSFNGATGAIQGVSSVNGQTGAVTIASADNVVSSFNGLTGAVQGVSSFNGATGAVTGASLGANTFTGTQTLTAGLTTSYLYASTGSTFASTLQVNGGATFSGRTDFAGNNNFATGLSAADTLNTTGSIKFNGTTAKTITTTQAPLTIRGVTSGTATAYNAIVLGVQQTDPLKLYSANGVVDINPNTDNAVNTSIKLNTNDGNIFEPILGSVTIQPSTYFTADRTLSIPDDSGTIALTKNVVTSFNGLTGAVGGVCAAQANTFTALQTFTAGISAAGGITFNGAVTGATATFTRLLTASGGISASGGMTLDGGKVWHSLNDGPTSGLDAGQLYGVTASLYASSLSTGLLYGGLVTINAGNSAAFDVSAGAGYIVTTGATFTAEPTPVINRVSWTAKTGVTLSGLTAQDTTWIYFDSNGNLNQQPEFFTDDQVQSTLAVGALVHPSRAYISLAKTIPNVSYATDKQYEQFIRAFGPLKVSGHTVQPNGANLKLNRTSGTAFILGRNYPNDPNNPSVVSDNAQTDCTFWRYYRGATAGSFVTVLNQTDIDPDNWDDGTGTLNSVGNGKYTIQRLFFFPGTPSVLGVYYGHAEYPSIKEAANNVEFEDFTEITNTATNAVFVGYLLIKKGTTNLTTAIAADTARIIRAGPFRTTTSGGGTIATNLDTLNDVTVTSVQDDDLLIYDTATSQWLNTPLQHIGVTRVNGLTGAVQAVSSFNGATGAVQGVSSVNGQTGAVTIASSTNVVTSFNGLTGAVTGASLGANTFTALNTFNAGISAAGGVTLAGTLQGTTASFTGLVSSTVGFSGSATNLVGNANGLTAGTASRVQIAEGAGSSYYLVLAGGAGNTGVFVDTSAPRWNYNASTGALTTSTGYVEAATLYATTAIYSNTFSGNDGTAPLYIVSPYFDGTNQAISIGDTNSLGDGTLITIDDAASKIEFSAGNIDYYGWLNVKNSGYLTFYDADASNYVAFRGPTALAANTTWTLPSADGSANQVLTTNGSGILSWSTPSGGGGSSVTSFNGLTGAVTGVSRVNGLSGGITLAAGTGITLTASGNTITVASAPKSTTQTLDFSEDINGVEIVFYGTGGDLGSSLQNVENNKIITAIIGSDGTDFNCVLDSIKSFYDPTNGWSARLIAKAPFTAVNDPNDIRTIENIRENGINQVMLDLTTASGFNTVDYWTTLQSHTVYHQDATYVVKTVTGQSWVAADSYITCKVLGLTTADHTPEDAILEGVQFEINNIVVGTGFDIIGHAPEGTYGKYTVKCIEQ
jgi:hypothetical protein